MPCRPRDPQHPARTGQRARHRHSQERGGKNQGWPDGVQLVGLRLQGRKKAARERKSVRRLSRSQAFKCELHRVRSRPPRGPVRRDVVAHHPGAHADPARGLALRDASRSEESPEIVRAPVVQGCVRGHRCPAARSASATDSKHLYPPSTFTTTAAQGQALTACL